MKPILWIIAFVILAVFAIVAIFIVTPNLRQSGDIFMELVMWPSGGESGVPIYTFVIRNDGTMISSYGRSRSDSGDESRTNNFIRSIRERETTTLSEDELQYISELVDTVVMLERNPDLKMTEVRTQSVITLLYNGEVFRRLITGESLDLSNEVLRLSPLTIHW